MNLRPEQTERFLDWFVNSLCHHEKTLIMARDNVIHCVRCFHNFKINDDLIEKFYKETLVGAAHETN